MRTRASPADSEIARIRVSAVEARWVLAAWRAASALRSASCWPWRLDSAGRRARLAVCGADAARPDDRAVVPDQRIRADEDEMLRAVDAGDALDHGVDVVEQVAARPLRLRGRLGSVGPPE